MTVDVCVPELGESITEGTLVRWFQSEGDPVFEGDSLAALETDKVTLEIPSPVTGTVKKQHIQEGSDVNVGALICQIEEGAVEKKATNKRKATKRSEDSSIRTQGIEALQDVPPLSPAASHLATQHHVDTSRLHATGPKGNILKEDVQHFLQKEASQAPSPQQGDSQREERVKMSRLRQTIARHLKSAQETAALLTTFNEINLSALVKARAQYKEMFEKKQGVRLGFMSFFVKAAVSALRALPRVNASIDGDHLVYKHYYNIGMAVGTPKGLVVPVLREAEHLSLAAIEKSIADFGQRARSGQLSLEEMQGGTFTITNGGVFGSLLSTPIINPPQSAVLGLHAIQKRPICGPSGAVEVADMMYVALSYDHRLIDGQEAVTFLVHIKERLEDPLRLFLDV